MNSKFRLKPTNRGISNEAVLAEIRRVAALFNSRRISVHRFAEHASISMALVSQRFGSWNKAVKLAGLLTTPSRRISDEKLFANLADVWLKLGKQPTTRDIDGPLSRYSVTAYVRHFKTIRKALEAFVAWANDISFSEHVSPVPEPKLPRTNRTPSWRLRAKVLARDGCTCRVCGARPEDGATLNIDHIVPWSKGGLSVMENLQVLCEKCNSAKGDVDPTDE